MAPYDKEQHLDEPLHVFVEDGEDDVKGSSDQEEDRTIRFALDVDVFYVLHRDDLTDDEVTDSHYSAGEIAAMNEAQGETADRLESGKKAKKSSPYRGLEAWTQQGQLYMNQRIFSCVDAVLDEQERQWTDDLTSTKRIAKVSRKFTKTSVDIALDLAKQDEKEARKTYQKELDQETEPDHNLKQASLILLIQASPLMTRKKKVSIKKTKTRTQTSMTSRKTHKSQQKVQKTSPKAPKSPQKLHKKSEPQSGFWSLSSGTKSLFDSVPKKQKKSKSPTKSKRKSLSSKVPRDSLDSKRISRQQTVMVV
jgi:hypothetical protein